MQERQGGRWIERLDRRQLGAGSALVLPGFAFIVADATLLGHLPAATLGPRAQRPAHHDMQRMVALIVRDGCRRVGASGQRSAEVASGGRSDGKVLRGRLGEGRAGGGGGGGGHGWRW